MIEARDLRKRFGAVQALAGVDFDVAPGELFGLLGPNGAGKTTTINLLTGLARPDGGAIHVADIDCTRRPKAAQHLIRVVADESNLNSVDNRTSPFKPEGSAWLRTSVPRQEERSSRTAEPPSATCEKDPESRTPDMPPITLI